MLRQPGSDVPAAHEARFSDANTVLRLRIQPGDSPAKQQGNHGPRTAIVIQIEFHKFGFRNGDTVYRMPVIPLKACRSNEIQRVGHLFISPWGRKIGPVRHRIGPLFLRDLIPEQTDALLFQGNVIPLGAIIIEKRSHHFIGARSVRQAVKHIQNDPVVLPAERDHVVMGVLRIQRHAMKRMSYHNRPMVFCEYVPLLLLLQFDAEIGVSLHGGIHSTTKNVRIDQVTHADPDPDLIRAFLSGHI